MFFFKGGVLERDGVLFYWSHQWGEGGVWRFGLVRRYASREGEMKLSDWASLLVSKESQKNDQSWSSSPEIVIWQESQQSDPTPSKDTGRLMQNLIHEPSETILLEELEDMKHTLDHDTPRG